MPNKTYYFNNIEKCRAYNRKYSLARRNAILIKRGLPLDSLLFKRGLSTQDKFWYYVHKCGVNDCWFWKGAKNTDGYGVMWNGFRQVRASRVSLEIKLGRPIQFDMLACHSCDNPICVNPNHLYEGTQKDNVRDCIIRNRRNIPYGENHYRTKFTSQYVLEIKKLYDTGMWRQFVIAEMFGVGQSEISRIITNKRWKN